ncbi:hypothetical protein SUVZ_08G1960 [Saccharomyces uvarum]|uniref:Uncharacterized protein n=1 Tax=Saccharomyces uvarum TaxID=230603 RepID=A0ABN8WUM0_SACUV|nr:hypothetical protein SUVZ_08G1960 [Saccharomyces uvarum]
MSSFEGIVHRYTARNVAFEFAPTGREKVLVMIGGMTDGLLTVPYTTELPHALDPHGYSVVNVQLSSSFLGFGTSSLDKDVEELKLLVDFLKSAQGGRRETIVLMGHSTGSQDVMHYLLRHGHSVAAGIIQASCSDRESFGQTIDPPLLATLNAHAQKLVNAGRQNDLLSSEYSTHLFHTPITAYRWCSLMVPGGDDDYFSSDLAPESLAASFGRLKTPLLVAYSENDQFVPAWVDKQALLARWRAATPAAVWSQHSGLIGGATHTVPEPAAQRRLLEMVARFLTELPRAGC